MNSLNSDQSSSSITEFELGNIQLGNNDDNGEESDSNTIRSNMFTLVSSMLILLFSYYF